MLRRPNTEFSAFGVELMLDCFGNSQSENKVVLPDFELKHSS